MNLDMKILKKVNEHRKYIREDLFIEAKGIHGISHAERVMYLALSIAKLENYSESDRNILIEASKFHDIGRINNGVCLVHGMLSNRKIDQYKLLDGYSKEDIAIIKYIIHNHCIHDMDTQKNIDEFAIKDKERAVRLLMAFKDSDGLDRVRIRDLDSNYLRIASSKKLVDLAESLLVNGIPFI